MPVDPDGVSPPGLRVPGPATAECPGDLLEGEARYRTLVDLSPDGIIVHAGGVCLFANPAAARLTGFDSADELPGQPLLDFVHPDCRALVQERIAGMLQQGASVPVMEEIFLRRDGSPFHVEVSAAPVPFRGQRAIMVVFRDIGERKRVDRTVRRQAAELQARERILDAALRLREPDDLLDRILEEVLELLGVEIGAVLLRAGDGLFTRACQGIERNRVVARLPLPVGPAEWMRTPQIAHGMLASTPAAELFPGRSEMASWASVPLRIPASRSGDPGDWLGLLTVASRRADALDPEEAAALYAVADEVALAIDHARAYREAQERLVRLQALRDVDRVLVESRRGHDLVRALLEELPADLGAVCVGLTILTDDQDVPRYSLSVLPDGQIVPAHPVRLSSDAADILVRGRESLLIADLDAATGVTREDLPWAGRPPVSWLGIPLALGERTKGILHVLGERARPFAGEVVEFWRSIARRVAAALENADEFEAAMERARAIEVLLSAQVRIASLPPAETPPVILDALARSCGEPRVSFFEWNDEEGALRLAAIRGVAPSVEAVARDLRFHLGEARGLVGLAASSRDPVYLPDCSRDPRWVPIETETRSVYFVPVAFGERLFGVVALLGTDVQGFPAPRRALADLFAHYIGSALEGSRLLAQSREAEGRFRSIFENAVEGIYQSRPDGAVIAANPALARMLGFDSPAQLLEKPEGFLDRLHADVRRRDEFLALMNAYDTVRGFEYRALRRNGEALWVSENAKAVRDAEGRLVRWEGIIEDITRRRELEEQLQQAQKMEAVGRLAGGVAHDFNNLLTAILGYSGLLLDRYDPADPSRREVQEIWNAGKRAASLTGQLLAFSRKQVLQPVVLDLGAVVASMENMLQRLIGEDVDLKTVVAPGLGRVRADPGQIEQVLLNLAVNSRDAMPHGGRLAIEATNVVVGDAPVPDRPGVAKGRWVSLAVTDNGSGMNAETRSHLFEPFFSTKPPGKGTGLGLAVVYGIVKQSGGHIFVRSLPGEGTTFTILLPEVRDARGGAGEGEGGAPARPVRGSETVMVVEDEASVRRLAREVLEAAGYLVIEAGDGHEALQLSGRFDRTIHLLLTDVVMPGMNGRELARRLCAARPGLRVLFTSGYTDLAVVEEGLTEPGTAFLQKPFAPARLTDAVRELLDRRLGEKRERRSRPSP